MSHRGNRPDCAFFLLLGVALAAFFLAMGGVCVYVAYWPEEALSHYYHHQKAPPRRHRPYLLLGDKDMTVDVQTPGQDLEQVMSLFDTEKVSEEKDQGSDGVGGNGTMKVLGPSCLVIGSLILLTVSVYAVRYKCDHEPEEPNIAFLRLASEMSLNWDPERNKYELMRNPKPSGLQHERIEEANELTSPTTPKY